LNSDSNVLLRQTQIGVFKYIQVYLRAAIAEKLSKLIPKLYFLLSWTFKDFNLEDI